MSVVVINRDRIDVCSSYEQGQNRCLVVMNRGRIDV
jgi:hypothetical protein